MGREFEIEEKLNYLKKTSELSELKEYQIKTNADLIELKKNYENSTLYTEYF